MGKKKRTQVFVLKPWCWYCEREFEDDKVLLQHQKSKHFKCQLCPRKLNTAGGLMVHSQQVHKCDPEPLTNTLPGRDGYDIEIFGMEGVPANAVAEWKSRKEAEAGTAALAAAAAALRPRQSYNVIPEADLQAALEQHKKLMAARNNPAPPVSFPPFGGAPVPFPAASFPPGMPPSFPGMPPPTMPPGSMPPFAPPAGFRPPFPPAGIPSFPPTSGSPLPQGSPATTAPGVGGLPAPPTFLPQSAAPAPATVVEIQPPKDGVMWPDATASPAEKRAQQSRYRYVSPAPEGEGEEGSGVGKKRKAAADFL
uniref:Zinc finger protein n=1 Tax=Kwoniella dejecticola CBS 10117 TaxID=1296121 RepID=A0A1A5ZXC2_9TREE|nr:zinc finger protein [Kwoniella dejecticola CBS 10117]OBR82455.1 zinc finger protein [Kwoniella dejecticola CBS 10117]